MKRLATLAVAATMFPAAALADTIGTYAAGDAQQTQEMTISYKDDQHVRMDVGQGNYLLMTGARAYMVSNQGGRLMAIDMDSIPKFAIPKAKPVNLADFRITKTTRTETIAGIQGDVYEITYDNQKHETVLSPDKRALGLNKAFLAMAKRLAQSLGADTAAEIELATREAQKHGYGGLLRSDRNLVLQSVADKTMPAGYYELPPGVAPMQLPKMPQMDPSAMQQMQRLMQEGPGE